MSWRGERQDVVEAGERQRPLDLADAPRMIAMSHPSARASRAARMSTVIPELSMNSRPRRSTITLRRLRRVLAQMLAKLGRAGQVKLAAQDKRHGASVRALLDRERGEVFLRHLAPRRRQQQTMRRACAQPAPRLIAGALWSPPLGWRDSTGRAPAVGPGGPGRALLGVRRLGPRQPRVRRSRPDRSAGPDRTAGDLSLRRRS
jgi:hypothetical protein